MGKVVAGHPTCGVRRLVRGSPLMPARPGGRVTDEHIGLVQRDPDLTSTEDAMHRAAAIARARLSERIAGRQYINEPCRLCRHWPAEEYAYREVR